MNPTRQSIAMRVLAWAWASGYAAGEVA